MRRRLFAALLALPACADAPAPGGGAVPAWRGVVDLTIAGPPGGEFARISGLATDPAGRVVVTDAGGNSVAVFDSAGGFVYVVGRQGAGPGEVNGPCCPGFDRAGRLWLRDAFNNRYNSYLLEPGGARHLGQRRMNHRARGFWAPLTFDAAGRLIDVGMVPGPAGHAVVRFHVDSADRVERGDTLSPPPADSLGQAEIARGDMILLVRQPHGARHLTAHAPDGGWAEAVSSRYRVRWTVGGDTTQVRSLRRDLIGPALSARERLEADSALDADAAQAGLARAGLPFGVPGSKPPLAALFFDGAGRLWVQLSQADGGANRADVYRPDGRRVAMAEWPGDVDLRLGAVGDRVAWGVREDSLGIPRAVRVRFE